jgi:molecular chaperone GrpE
MEYHMDDQEKMQDENGPVDETAETVGDDASSNEVQDDFLKEMNEKADADARDSEKKLEKLGKMSQQQLIKQYMKLDKQYSKVQGELQSKAEESADFLNKYKRSLADMENLRKRTVQEKQDSLKYANFNIVGDLLVVLDDFQRAIDAFKEDESKDATSFAEGIQMIEKQFADLLFTKYKVEKYGEEGEVFDPNLHQAMMMEEGKDKKEIVTQVFRKGYKLHDRVVRPAQVKISKPAN